MMHFTRKIIQNSRIHLNFVEAQSRSFSQNVKLPPPCKLSYLHEDPPQPSNKSPVLCFHGLFGSKYNWRSLLKPIAEATNRQVYTFDLRNHGESEHSPPEHQSMLGMASDIEHILNSQSQSKTVLIGHSLGGRACMQFAALFPGMVEKMIILDIGPPLVTRPFMDFTVLRDEFIDGLEAALKPIPPKTKLIRARILADQNLLELIPDKITRGYFLMSLTHDSEGRVVWKYNLDGFRSMLHTGDIVRMAIPAPCHVSALFLHGTLSQYILEEDYGEILKVFPCASFVPIAGAGHLLHTEKPQECLQEIVKFINAS